jgi:nitroimidazol reductase NimA-like FMN-containing flavoprotein (pyridoxamine 5'-phosphate oxidase superfamily)
MSDLPVDPRTGLEVLTREECLRLLGAHHLGRLAVVVAGRPVIFPVNYCLDGDQIVFRTNEGTKLHGARGGPVAFEIDGTDGYYHQGWSVIVVGVGEPVDDESEIARLERLPLGLWTAAPKPYWVRIRPGAITGRRIPPHGHNVRSARPTAPDSGPRAPEA